MPKHKLLLITVIVSILLLGVGLACVLPALVPATMLPTIRPAGGNASLSAEPPPGCTVFTVAKGERVFFGGNDDYIHPDSYYWVDFGIRGYGAIWIGLPDNVQQGVNEKGLAYDANGLPRVDVNPHLERTPVSGGYGSYPIHILRQCATVEEVIAWVNTHQWHSYMHDQMHFADATGDAVIISAGADGEVVFTRKPQGDSYLVSTNFNVANPAGHSCWRYQTAQEMLDKLVQQEGELTAQDAAAVLDAVHQGGGSSWTIESLVADLPNGIVYLYYFHQFDKPIVLNVAEEIANRRSGGPLSALFPADVQEEAARRYARIQAQQDSCQVLGKIWLGVDLGSLALLLLLSIKRRRGWSFWIPVVVILGPLGLLLWLVAGRRPQPGTARAALLEATGDVTPMVLLFVAMLVVALLLPAAQASQLLQIVLLLGVPPLVGWLFFHGPLLAWGSRAGYLRTLWRCLPQAWAAANLGLAGLMALALPLATLSTRICAILPLSPWVVITWWALAVLSTLVSGLLLFGFEFWAVRRGFRGWSSLATGEGEILTAPWRKVWWWIPLSYVVLVGGLIVYALLQ